MIETIAIFGKTISLYYFFWFMAIIATLVTGWSIKHHFDFSFSRSTLLICLGFSMGFLLILATSYLSGGGQFNGFNFARIVCLEPAYFWILSKLLNEPFGKVADFLAPMGSILVGISHFGCIFTGCCHGYPSAWGLYSNEASSICFPIQPIEAMAGILIAIVLIVMIKNKIQTNRIYAWYMVLFGGSRFIFEFFRDNEKIWSGISELALHAAIACVLGMIVLIYSNHNQAKGGKTS